MSQVDFQNRIQRINAKAPLQAAPVGPQNQVSPHKKRENNYGLLAIAAVFVSSTVSSVKWIFNNFEAYRQDEAWGILALSVFVAVGSLIISHLLIKRAIPPKPKIAKEKSRASSRAKTVSSIIGIAFGVIGGFYSVLGAAVAHVDTEQAKILEMSGTVMPVALLLVSLLLGFIGLFARHLALGRIPIYCLVSCILFVVGFRMSGADVTDFAMLTLSTM